MVIYGQDVGYTYCPVFKIDAVRLEVDISKKGLKKSTICSGSNQGCSVVGGDGQNSSDGVIKKLSTRGIGGDMFVVKNMHQIPRGCIPG